MAEINQLLKTILIILTVGGVAIIAVKIIEKMHKEKAEAEARTAEAEARTAEAEAGTTPDPTQGYMSKTGWIQYLGDPADYQTWLAGKIEAESAAAAAAAYTPVPHTRSQEIQAAVISRGCYTSDEKFWAYRYDKTLFDWMRSQTPCWR